MRNIKLQIEYVGTNYCGWQRQSSRSSSLSRCPPKTIQATIEKTLRKILQEKVHLVASGRTDAGVHAFAQVANFKTQTKLSLGKLQLALNSSLPEDIKISRVEEVGLTFHSRFSAKGKIYRYVILNRPYPSVFLRNRAYFFPYPLDLELMRKEARCLVGRHNFKAFCSSGSSTKDTVRTIKRISIQRASFIPGLFSCENYKDSFVIIEVEADGFLYNMARNIVGTLIEIGRKRFPVGWLKKILTSGDRRLAGPTVAPGGLYLVKVNY
jgi:tRNA pseudouridine38-40 synthase